MHRGWHSLLEYSIYTGTEIEPLKGFPVLFKVDHFCMVWLEGLMIWSRGHGLPLVWRGSPVGCSCCVEFHACGSSIFISSQRVVQTEHLCAGNANLYQNSYPFWWEWMRSPSKMEEIQYSPIVTKWQFGLLNRWCHAAGWVLVSVAGMLGLQSQQ